MQIAIQLQFAILSLIKPVVQGASFWKSSGCARLAFGYQWDTGLTKLDYYIYAQFCDKWLHEASNLGHNLPKLPSPPEQASCNFSLAAVWQQYTENPDPCHRADGICYSRLWSGHSAKTCKCIAMVGLMRVQTYGSIDGNDCSIDKIKDRFYDRFPTSQFGLNYLSQLSYSDVSCQNEDENSRPACDCTKNGICDLTNKFGWNLPVTW